jgi:predicted O-linked N-acetylglucosamine transferase (SPINDLY family)
LQIKPETAAFLQNLGNALRSAGQWDEAILSYRRVLELNPAASEAAQSLANALLQLGRLPEAVAAFRFLARRAPDDPKSWMTLADVLQRAGHLDEALASYRRGLDIQPDYPRGHSRVGCLLQRQGRLDEAAAAFHRALEIQPMQTEAHYWLADVLKEQGRWVEARAEMRRVVELAPDLPRAHSDLILVLQTSVDLSEQDVAAEAARWNERFGRSMKQFIQPHRNDRDPERRLRIGYVSPDFCDHVVGRNLQPLFRHHDHAQCEIICYSAGIKSDDMTAEFRRLADRWHDVAGMGDEELAGLIQREEVDVLVDLTLHAAGSRLPVFARQPAPVQVSFAGYPGRTGLETIAYHISDRYLETAPEAESAVLIDSFWCYDPCGVELDVLPSPAERNGFVTFASLNDPSKVNELALKLWAQVLLGVKDSRLMMLRRQGTHLQRTIDFLAQQGVAPERIEFFDQRPRPLYLQFYQLADIMLDPFPYNGHTTSLDALWMGVPVVSLVGPRRISRAGLSQLSNLGLAELAAYSEEEYVRIATSLAGDLPRMVELRATLRSRMERSVLMDAPRFTRQIEAAYRAMWRQWCSRREATP